MGTFLWHMGSTPHVAVHVDMHKVWPGVAGKDVNPFLSLSGLVLEDMQHGTIDVIRAWLVAHQLGALIISN